jgi:hypothetical protein
MECFMTVEAAKEVKMQDARVELVYFQKRLSSLSGDDGRADKGH